MFVTEDVRLTATTARLTHRTFSTERSPFVGLIQWAMLDGVLCRSENHRRALLPKAFAGKTVTRTIRQQHRQTCWHRPEVTGRQ